MDTLNRIIAILSTQQKTQKDLTDYIGLQKGVFTQWKAAGSTSYLKQIVNLLYLFDIYVSQGVKLHSYIDLDKLVNARMTRHPTYFNKNILLKSSYDFFKKIVDFLLSKAYTNSETKEFLPKGS